MNHSSNHLLASVAAEVYEALHPHLSLRELPRGNVIAEAGSHVTEVYFPLSGIISLVVPLHDGSLIESAMIGRDGVLNAASALDGKVSLNKSLVQLAGFASVISAEHLTQVADQFHDFRAVIIRHEQVLFAQSQQSAACNASHRVESRLCRWLLRTRDLAGDDELLITQEFLAQMLGVQRSSVSITANTLQKAGLIQYKRGRVHVTNVSGLKEGACECYETVRSYYETLLSPEKIAALHREAGVLHSNSYES